MRDTKAIKNTTSSSGFTLVELIVVILLLGVMSTILFSVLGSIMSSKDIIMSQRVMYRTARQVFDRMNTEISSLVAEPLAQGADGTTQNARSSANVFLNGQNQNIGQVSKDTLRFVSAQAGQYFFGAQTRAGRTEVYYHLEEPPDDTRQDSADDNFHRMVLVREEIPTGLTDATQMASKKVIFPVAENVISLNFRYMRNKKWKNDWINTRQLPNVIEVTLSLVGDNGETKTFQTAFSVSKRTTLMSTYEQFLGSQ